MATGLSRTLLASKPPPRAFAESVLVGGFLAFALSLFYWQINTGIYTDYFVTITIFSIALFAYRLHIFPGGIGERLLNEAAVGLVVGVLVGLAVLEIIFRVTPSIYWAELMYHRPGIHIWPFEGRLNLALYFSPPTFTIARITKYIWRAWDDVRRRYFVYELVHWFLMFVALALALTFAGIIIATDTNPPTFVRRLGEIIIVSDGLLVLLLAVLFFPLTLFPFFISQRITRRIKSLSDATGALRAGDYQVRAQVRGADEIAGLQRDFNAMAEELQATLGALENERNTVFELLKSRQELFASVSHELRTPLSVIKGYLESLQTGDPTTLESDLAVMGREVEQLERLISDVFTLARAELTQLDLRLETIDVIPLLRNIVEVNKPLVWRKNRVEVVADLPGGLPPVRVDASRLEQIVQNLLHNAVKHTPPGGAVIVSASKEGEAVLIEVRDTGGGIPPDDLLHIWEPFFRTSEARDGGLTGTGLGLALVRELTEAMGGTVAAESDPGEGSCFSVRF